MEESKAVQRYTTWINTKNTDPTLRRELLNIISSPEEIESRFDEDLDFGTAGIRAVMGAGTSRINIYTIAAAAKGFAKTLNEAEEETGSVVISYDSRHHSKEFAETAARVLAGSGISVLLSDSLRPVPMLSFAVRYYQAAGGVMITASHNPKEYNGMKVYGKSGGQLTPAEAAEVRANIPAFPELMNVLDEAPSMKEALESEKIRYIGAKWDDAYNDMLKDISESHLLADEVKERIRIVYSPMNGSGAEPVRRILNGLGYRRVFLVSEQEKPDGDFPTLRVPNPEYEDSFELAKKYARAVLADVIIATDPDSDRLGVAVPDNNGDYKMLTGNQVGIMLMEYILSAKSSHGELKDNSFCVTSIVSSRLSRLICRRYGVELVETLTGSKYASECIRSKTEEGAHFLFGFEEGNGYLFNSGVREKDAVAACVAIAEMAAVSKSYGMKLTDQLTSIYRLYGYAAEKSFSITLEGAEGRRAIERCMNYYRMLKGKLGALGADLYYKDVKKFIDKMPEANVLVYELNDLDWIAIRPSGTEPKLKIYFGFYGEKFAAENRLSRISQLLLKDINTVLSEE